jgi:hypothetical protein
LAPIAHDRVQPLVSVQSEHVVWLLESFRVP